MNTRSPQTTNARRIMLRGSWRTENIGDVGHTPGMLQILREHLPDVAVTLWPNDIKGGVEEMLLRNFPGLRIARTDAELKTAFAECDFLLHGSATSLAQPASVERWKKETGGKPYGVYGITLAAEGDKAQALVFNPGLTDSQRALLNGARFLFLRDGVSLKFARQTGITCPVVELGQDSAFGVKLRDEAKAADYLRKNGLEDRKFLCVIPRLRNTPFWGVNRAPQSDFDKMKHAVNEANKEVDFEKFRAAIIAFVRETGFKVLLCPECDDHMILNKEMILNRLPDDVRGKTVWRETFWPMDEAVAVYARALGLLSMDMHSPIMATANGTPAIVCRWWQQTSKGFMWQDIGLGDWLFDMDTEKNGDRITEAVLSLARNPADARAKVAKAMEFVRDRQKATMVVLDRELKRIGSAA
ncbi:MAG: polysaccharide pyruvyl transferase family protein [Akkermansiaceae bacterium]|nr:polysaccharide pyruvyl transferase family protein [Armatimonadota bacterium]